MPLVSCLVVRPTLRHVVSVTPFLGTNGFAFHQVLVPRCFREAVVDWHHRYALVYRADNLTEVTTYTFTFVNDRNNALKRIWMNTLVGSIMTSHHAAIAADAFIGINLGNGFIVEI